MPDKASHAAPPPAKSSTTATSDDSEERPPPAPLRCARCFSHLDLRRLRPRAACGAEGEGRPPAALAPAAASEGDRLQGLHIAGERGDPLARDIDGGPLGGDGEEGEHPVGEDGHEMLVGHAVAFHQDVGPACSPDAVARGQELHLRPRLAA